MWDWENSCILILICNKNDLHGNNTVNYKSVIELFWVKTEKYIIIDKLSKNNWLKIT